MEDHLIERPYRFAIPVNPEPWAVGPLSWRMNGGKKIPFIGKNEQLDNYKQAVQLSLKQEIAEQHPGVTFPLAGKVTIHCVFRRRLDKYQLIASGRKSSNKQADATNMQKAIEDALQGVLLGNDRNVWSITSEIDEQGPDVSPGTILTVIPWVKYVPFPGSEEADFWDRAARKFKAANDFTDFDNTI